MAEHSITNVFSNAGTRNEVRMRVVSVFSSEEAGTGRDTQASKYTYFVETLSDGNRVYLRRPANLHNGFDFLVCVENCNFNEGGHSRNYPKQEDIINDLRLKKAESSIAYLTLFQIIERIYSCNDVPDDEYVSLHFSSGLPVDYIPKILKWLFIEQDIRYWNYSGRNMLWEAIQSL